MFQCGCMLVGSVKFQAVMSCNKDAFQSKDFFSCCGLLFYFHKNEWFCINGNPNYILL